MTPQGSRGLCLKPEIRLLFLLLHSLSELCFHLRRFSADTDSKSFNRLMEERFFVVSFLHPKRWSRRKDETGDSGGSLSPAEKQPCNQSDPAKLESRSSSILLKFGDFMITESSLTGAN